MLSEQISITALIGAASAAAGWLIRGLSVASQWGALRAEMSGLRADQARFEGSFQLHIAQDAEERRTLMVQLNALHRDVGKLLGRTEGEA